MRAPIWSWVVLLSAPLPAWAITPPIAGAVAKPDPFVVHWPFAAGERIELTSGYGPDGGSALHVGTDRPAAANDYYALDLVLPDRANNGLGSPVLAIASGTVVKAGWATEGWAGYGQRVIVEHDWSGDGHRYTSIYCHLDAVLVQEGQTVAAGDAVGNVGGSSYGSPSGVGVHLHFALHQDSEIGGSGTGGSYGGHAVVPEIIDGAEDLTAGLTVVSENDGSEIAAPCAVVGPGETILDDRGPCFRRYGPPEYWHEEARGHEDASVWTFTTDDPQPTNWGVWTLELAEAGTYDLFAWIPSGLGQSARAVYRVRHAGQDGTVEKDQTDASDDWLALGTFDLAAGGDQSVRLEDDTGEPYTGEGSTRIVFDAIRIAPSAAPGGPDAGVDPPDRDAGNVDADAALPGSLDPGGCSCRAGREGASGAHLFALLVALACLLGRSRL